MGGGASCATRTRTTCSSNACAGRSTVAPPSSLTATGSSTGCATPTQTCGSSLTTIDVDFYGGWGPQRGVPATPQVCRHIEWTRGGRRVVRANQGARPMPGEPRAEHQEAMLDLFADIRATLAAGAPRVAVRDEEILLIDNYRCWHGRDPHDTPRFVRVMTVTTTEAL
jgi:hypothetical protein